MTNNNLKLLFLVDSEAKNIKWLAQYFDKKNYTTLALGMNSSMKNRTISWRRIILFYKYINLAIRSIVKSDEQDVIISENFIVGAFAAFFCKIFNLKRTILSLYMISHEKGKINKMIRKIIYNTAFKYSNFYTTVNSKELVGTYSKEYKIKGNNFFELHDPIPNYWETAPFTEGNGSVFCGGEARRDWNTLFKAARLLPNVQFIAIARKINFDTTLSTPNNVALYFDTDENFFYNRLKESSIVAMPLSATAPAGLTVMFKTALLSKPVIITSTFSTRNYIENKLNGILIDMYDEKTLAEEISFLLSDSKLREKLCIMMNETIEKFSLESYLKTLESIILQIKKN